MANINSNKFQKIDHAFYTRRDILLKDKFHTNAILRCTFCNKFFTYIMLVQSADANYSFKCPHCGKR